MRQKVIEHIKTAVIVLLLCSAAVLAFAANFPQTLQQLRDSLSTSGAATPPTAERGEFAVAAKPIAISIRSETGQMCIRDRGRDRFLLHAGHHEQLRVWLRQ